MDKGMTVTLVTGALAAVFLLALGPARADVYKVVDAEGNVTYTDQAPADGSSPMTLPELSIVKTDYVPEAAPTDDTANTTGDEAASEPTPRELRQMYKDFRITQPAAEETFWGTANTVVIGWGSSAVILPSMSVRVYIDGQVQSGSQGNMFAATLDRGEHQVYAELLDARGRRVVTSATVTFFVKQNGVGSNQPQAVPHRGN